MHLRVCPVPVALGLMLSLAMGGPARGDPPQPDQREVIRQIIEGARRNTAGLKSGRAVVLVNAQMTAEAGQLYHPPQQKEIKWVFSGKMHRYEQLERGPTIDKRPQYSREIYSHDGDTARYFVPQAKEGAVRKKDDLGDTYYDPRQYGFHYERSATIADALSKASQEGKLKLLPGVQRRDGPRLVLRMDVDADQFERLYIDPGRGYLIREKEAVSKRNPSQIFGREEVLECVEYRPGLWFPTLWRNRGFTRAGKVWLSVEGRIRDFQPNVEVSRQAFSLDFPVGTRVSDYQSDTVYYASTPWLTFRRTITALLLLATVVGFRWWRRRRAHDPVEACAS